MVTDTCVHGVVLGSCPRCWRIWKTDERADIAELRAQLATAVGLLREREWTPEDEGYNPPTCLECSGYQWAPPGPHDYPIVIGHKPECRLAALLAPSRTIDAESGALRGASRTSRIEGHDPGCIYVDDVRPSCVLGCPRAQLAALTEERDRLHLAVHALVDALPRCTAFCEFEVRCSKVATKAWRRGEARYCDMHAPDGCPDYPRAAPLRNILSLLRGT